LAKGRISEPTAAILDLRTLQSTLDSGHYAGFEVAQSAGRLKVKVHAAVDIY
jgi:hypothetical protein